MKRFLLLTAPNKVYPLEIAREGSTTIARLAINLVLKPAIQRQLLASVGVDGRFASSTARTLSSVGPTP